jgi:hypothetical protein
MLFSQPFSGYLVVDRTDFELFTLERLLVERYTDLRSGDDL